MPPEFRLHITIGNFAMQDPEDIAEALRKVADEVEQRVEYPRAVLDRNGNNVGQWRIAP